MKKLRIKARLEFVLQLHESCYGQSRADQLIYGYYNNMDIFYQKLKDYPPKTQEYFSAYALNFFAKYANYIITQKERKAMEIVDKFLFKLFQKKKESHPMSIIITHALDCHLAKYDPDHQIRKIKLEQIKGSKIVVEYILSKFDESVLKESELEMLADKSREFRTFQIEGIQKNYLGHQMSNYQASGLEQIIDFIYEEYQAQNLSQILWSNLIAAAWKYKSKYDRSPEMRQEIAKQLKVTQMYQLLCNSV